MATPMTAAQVTAQLTKWGIAYKAYRSDWATHNRAGHGDWGPVNGFMWHHTGSDSDVRAYLWDGSVKLPGPLCQFHIDASGMVWLMGWGRANHAGGGDPSVLNHVIAEDYTGILHPHYHQDSAGAVDGNAHFYGVEIGYSGKHGMSPAQYSTALKLSAAILDFHKWTAKSVIGHGEWSDWKWDPGYADGRMMDMNAVRNDVADVLSRKDRNADGDTVDPGEPNAPKVPTPAPTPVPTTKTVTLNVGDSVVIGGSVLKVTEVK
jgi:hypothetical protein